MRVILVVSERRVMFVRYLEMVGGELDRVVWRLFKREYGILFWKIGLNFYFLY